MKEIKIRADVNNENKILTMEPLNKATGEAAETQILTARLFTQEEVDKEYEDLMQEGCRTYTRKHGRIREIR